MTLSKDTTKRAVRDNWYWPTVAEHWMENNGELIVMLPGAHGMDARTAQQHLKVATADMICVDSSSGVLASFSREFPGTETITGDVFEVLEVLGECSPPQSFGMIDLDLCGCVTDEVIDGLKKLRENLMLADGCVVGLTISRRWKATSEQLAGIQTALQPAKTVASYSYTNNLKHSNMLTSVFVMGTK